LLADLHLLHLPLKPGSIFHLLSPISFKSQDHFPTQFFYCSAALPFKFCVKMRFSITLIFALSLVVSAAPAPQATSTCTKEAAASASAALITRPTAPYDVMSIRSASPVHLLPMQARGQNFYLGGSPATYCPQPPVTECPSGLDTVFAGLGALVGFRHLHDPGQTLTV
jgi:hypothetical protein